MSMKNSNDTIGNRTRDLPVCTAVPQESNYTLPVSVRLLDVVFEWLRTEQNYSCSGGASTCYRVVYWTSLVQIWTAMAERFRRKLQRSFHLFVIHLTTLLAVHIMAENVWMTVNGGLIGSDHILI
jgi:hypothetical protein